MCLLNFNLIFSNFSLPSPPLPELFLGTQLRTNNHLVPLLSQAYRRKSSNCQRSSSVESGQNNSSANQKKCKRGVVTDFTNNNLGGAEGTSQSEHKTLVQKFREFLAKRETHSLYIWPPDSGLR